MVDLGTEALAAVALVGSAIAVALAWIESARLRTAREQLALLQRLTLEQSEKVERLGSLVSALRATVETKVQKLQISALERQVEMATAALKTQDAPVEIPRIRSQPGTPRAAAIPGQLRKDLVGAPSSAMDRFRAWAGWRRPTRGREMGTSLGKGPQP